MVSSGDELSRIVSPKCRRQGIRPTLITDSSDRWCGGGYARTPIGIQAPCFYVAKARRGLSCATRAHAALRPHAFVAIARPNHWKRGKNHFRGRVRGAGDLKRFMARVAALLRSDQAVSTPLARVCKTSLAPAKVDRHTFGHESSKTARMKSPCLVLVLLSFFAGLASGQPASSQSGDKVIAAVRAADDARIAAMVAVDRARMSALYSKELRYAHSSGKVDTQASFIESLVTKEIAYYGVEYQERNFVPAVPGIVLMSGGGLFRVATAGQRQELDLRFLAVWREEQGVWRLLAWQSNRQPAPAAPAK